MHISKPYHFIYVSPILLVKNAYFSEMKNQNFSNSFFRYPYLCKFTCNLCQYEYISSNTDILSANYCF